MDRLAGIFNQHTLRAQVFFSGTLCRHVSFDEPDKFGHLHLLRGGTVTAHSPRHPTLVIDRPSLLFYPAATTHHFAINHGTEADLMCAKVQLGKAVNNPLAASLPLYMLIPLASLNTLQPTLELLFAEALGQRCGRQVAIDRLCEYLLIQLLRYVMDEQLVSLGMLAGLADKRLSRSIIAIHHDAGHEWTLENLADVAGMSRARFAVHFRETVGVTPGEYLTSWRIGLAQVLISKGKHIGMIADEIGYGSPAAFSRAFKAQTGMTPTEWRATLSE